MSTHTVPLSKNPVIRPIGIGEILRRIIGKITGWLLKDDGLKAGAEAAIHSMREIFNDQQTEAVTLIDASNVFNSLTPQVALHNIRIICPAFSPILINTYRESLRLFITGGKELRSIEGTTQGDNLAMEFFPSVQNSYKTS